MIKKIKFTKEASHEFHDSVDWYESSTKGLGLKFTDEIESTIERIKLNPALYPSILEDIKRIQLNKFPFSMFYKVEGEILIILRIFHNKRKPIYW